MHNDKDIAAAAAFAVQVIRLRRCWFIRWASAAAKTQFKNIFCSIDGVCKSRPVNVNEVGEGAMTAKEVGARQANVVDVNVARSCIQEKEKRKSFSALSLFLSLFISVENEKVKVPSI